MPSNSWKTPRKVGDVVGWLIWFECDQNLWDAVEVKIGRTQGVESHHTLGDYW